MVKQGKYFFQFGEKPGDQTPRTKHECVDVFKREKNNFKRIRSSLADDSEYQGKYVAVYSNEIVGSSEDRLDLFLEMSTKYPCGSFYIGKVYFPQNRV